MIKYLKNILKFNFSNISVTHKTTVSNSASIPFEFSQDNYKEIEKILKKYPTNYKKSGVIPLLFLAQKQNNNFLSLSAMKKVSQILEIPEMDVFEVASFYSMFNRTPVGKYHLQICKTTPCMLRGSDSITKRCEEILKIKNGQTTKDGMFTIQEVECLGACANAPMMQINNEYIFEDLSPEMMEEFIKNLKEKGIEGMKKGPQTARINSEGELGRTTLKDYNPEVKHERDFKADKEAWEKEKAVKK